MKNKKLVLKSQQRFRSAMHNVFTEKVAKIVVSANNDKSIQSIDSIETYAYGTSKELVIEKERNNVIKQCKID